MKKIDRCKKINLIFLLETQIYFYQKYMDLIFWNDLQYKNFNQNITNFIIF